MQNLRTSRCYSLPNRSLLEGVVGCLEDLMEDEGPTEKFPSHVPTPVGNRQYSRINGSDERGSSNERQGLAENNCDGPIPYGRCFGGDSTALE